MSWIWSVESSTDWAAVAIADDSMIRGVGSERGVPNASRSVKDAEIRLPRADGFAVLVGHGFDDLLDMAEVVNDPGGEQIPQGDRAEFRMGAGEVELSFRKVKR